jgi:hypothetical protein
MRKLDLSCILLKNQNSIFFPILTVMEKEEGFNQKIFLKVDNRGAFWFFFSFFYFYYFKGADRWTGWTLRFVGFSRFFTGFGGLTPVLLQNGFAPLPDRIQVRFWQPCFYPFNRFKTNLQNNSTFGHHLKFIFRNTWNSFFLHIQFLNNNCNHNKHPPLTITNSSTTTIESLPHQNKYNKKPLF